MIRTLLARFQQKHRTTTYPVTPAVLPDRFRGLPHIAPAPCRETCAACSDACPTGALNGTDRISIDLGKCLFCTACTSACPDGRITFGRDHRLAVSRRNDLVLRSDAELRLADQMGEQLLSLYGRSFKLREVSAAGCNACEADTNVLSTVGFDLGRFGIQFVASPRHADAVYVTGPVSENMREALLQTYQAVPEPRLVIAAGACAISGGPFAGNPEQHNGVTGMLPVDLFIPGCPPHPLTILDGLLRLLGHPPKP
jgi:Ni,Fe-hydrogenase III small subunit/ferredoxin